ncbi:MAG TPA: hypothetical protein VGJ25_01330 [Gaiellaceae bacterium]|jgi:hypothetical protein
MIGATPLTFDGPQEFSHEGGSSGVDVIWIAENGLGSIGDRRLDLAFIKNLFFDSARNRWVDVGLFVITLNRRPILKFSERSIFIPGDPAAGIPSKHTVTLTPIFGNGCTVKLSGSDRLVRGVLRFKGTVTLA